MSLPVVKHPVCVFNCYGRITLVIWVNDVPLASVSIVVIILMDQADTINLRYCSGLSFLLDHMWSFGPSEEAELMAELGITRIES
jgi:hypothetical protein